MKSVIKLSFLAATVALAVGCNQEEAKAPIASAVAAEQPAQLTLSRHLLLKMTKPHTPLVHHWPNTSTLTWISRLKSA